MINGATYHDGETALSRPAATALEGPLFVIHCNDGTHAAWPVEGVRRIGPAADDGPTRLACPAVGPGRLTLPSGIDRKWLESTFPNLSKPAPGRWRNRRRLFVLAAAALLSVVFLATAGIPAIARFTAHNLSPETERKLGDETRRQLLRAMARAEKRPFDQTLVCRGRGTAVLADLAERLNALGPDAPALTIETIDLGVENAFALPGGRILVFRGLLETLRHPNELAGILAHEMAHIKRKHGIELVVREAGNSVLIGLLFGDVAGGSLLAGIGRIVVNAGHSREAEREADEIGLELLARAGIDARPFADLFERLHAEHGDMEDNLGLLMTHPMSEDRVSFIRANGKPGKTALSDKQWQEVHRTCD